MANDKKSSQLAVAVAVDLLDGHYIDIYMPTETLAADQNQRTALPSLKTYFGILKDNLTAVVAPTVSDDNTGGYAVGSRWIDTVAKKSYVCIVTTTGAAVWSETTAQPGTEPAKINTSATAVPAATDDNTAGYVIGSQWIWPAQNRVWACVDATTNVAVWVETSGIPSTAPINLWSATAAPTVNDDASDTSGNGTFAIGSQWLWAAQSRQWTCTVSTTGAAVWTELTDLAATIKNNFVATIAPTASDDDTDSYEAGSRWLIPSTNRLWTCESATTGAAVWLEQAFIEDLIVNKMDGVAAPGINNDVDEGYTAGSVWRWGQRLWMCRDNTNGAAKWIEFAVQLWHFQTVWKGTNVSNSTLTAVGRIPEDAYLLDAAVEFLSSIASPDNWDVDIKVGGTNIVTGMVSSDFFAWGVADLAKTLATNTLTKGDAIDVVNTVTVSDWQGQGIWLKVAQPV